MWWVVKARHGAAASLYFQVWGHVSTALFKPCGNRAFCISHCLCTLYNRASSWSHKSIAGLSLFQLDFCFLSLKHLCLDSLFPALAWPHLALMLPISRKEQSLCPCPQEQLRSFTENSTLPTVSRLNKQKINLFTYCFIQKTCCAADVQWATAPEETLNWFKVRRPPFAFVLW